MKLVSRADWGARPYRTPSGAIGYAGPRKGVKVHYLGTPYNFGPHSGCAAYVRKLQTSHMDGNGWSDIGYSFVVCEHGYVYEGRGLKRRNSANGNTALNDAHYAVCGLVGNSGSTVPTAAQLNGIRDAIEYCRREGPAGNELKGHRDGYATDCPGGPLYKWVQEGCPRQPESGEQNEEDEGMSWSEPLTIHESEAWGRAETASAGAWLVYGNRKADVTLAEVRELRKVVDALVAEVARLAGSKE